MTPAIFRATYSDIRLVKGRKVVQFVFEVPLEESTAAQEVLGGMPNPAAEVWCAIARLDPNKVGVATPEREADKDQIAPSGPSASRKPVAPDKRLAQRAGILCADALFRRFLEDHAKMENVTEEEAAIYIRTKCGVESRSEIKPGTLAATRLDFIESAFIAWRDKDKFVEAAE